VRHERKYRIENVSHEAVLQDMMSIAGAFDNAYPDRWVNSVYLDSTDFNALNENLSGISQRSKYRMRWYGDLNGTLHTPILEEKVKHNMLGYKNLLQLESTKLNQDSLRKALDLKQIKDLGLIPTVTIRYLRTYLESYDHRVRITIDRNLQYFGINNYQLDPYGKQDDAIILEVKYDEEDEEDIDYILQDIRYRLTKNSKFVSAVMNYWS